MHSKFKNLPDVVMYMADFNENHFLKKEYLKWIINTLSPRSCLIWSKKHNISWGINQVPKRMMLKLKPGVEDEINKCFSRNYFMVRI